MPERVRWRDVPRLIATLAAEGVLFVGLWGAGPLLGSVPLTHLGRWVHATAPSDALTALARLSGLVLAGWLLVTTVLYLGASLAAAEGLVRRTGWVTLPVVRRMVDGFAAASILASTVTATATGAVAAVPGHAAVVQTWRPLQPATGGRVGPAPATAESRVAAAVSDRLVGRHFPHPGSLRHVVAISYSNPDPHAPSPGNNFAGLVPGTKVVVVQPGDCLSVIAEQHLGDWRLDAEIHQLNVGRVQPDGRALSDDHWIYPGWVLVMPADAKGTLVVPAAPVPTATVAARPVPSPTATQSDLPSASDSPSSRLGRPTIPMIHRSSTVTVPVPSRAGRLTDPAPTVAPGTSRTQSDSPSASGSIRQMAPPPVNRLAPSGHQTPAPLGGGSHDAGLAAPVPAVPIVGVGGLVAAGVMWRLRRGRRDQMHARRTGRGVPVNPPAVVAAEMQARVIADYEAMRWADAGLRYLGGQLAERLTVTGDGKDPDQPVGDETIVPSVVLVRAGARGLEVMISPFCLNAPEGWEALDDGSVWALHSDIALDDLEARASGRWPLLPALVSVGTTVDGAVLANLEHAGSLAVEGDPDTVRAVLGQVLVELTSQPWADEMLDGLYATGDMSVPRLPGVSVDGDPMALAEKLDMAADRTAAGLVGCPSVAARRAVDGDWLPRVAVAFAGSDSDVVRCLIEAATADRSGVAVVVAGAVADARWRLSVDGAGHAVLAGRAGDRPFQLRLDMQVGAETVGLLGEALAAATKPDEAAAVTIEETSTVMAGPIERGEVELRLLGSVRLVGDAGTVEPARRDAPLAVLAYLTTHPGRVGSQDVAAALWPADATKERFGMPAAKTVQNVISRARSLLGDTAKGEHRLRLEHGAYVVDESVTTDWQRFQTLAAQARTSPADEAAVLYREALTLIEGPPFGGSLDSQFFEWVAAEQLDYTITAAIVDAAEDLARLALEARDFELVGWAVERGLEIDPAREQLYQYWMHALGQSANPGKVTAVWQRLCAALHAHIDPAQGPSRDSQAVYRCYVGRQNGRR